MKTAAFAAKLLQQGRVVACPTDTVYGLLADATNTKAVQRVFQIKGRGKAKPVSVFVGSIAMAKRVAKISRAQERFLKRAWPGKITAVLESRGILPKGTEARGKIGLRIPKHRFVQQILKAIGRPLTGTSANISGLLSCRSAKEVEVQFQNRKYKPDSIIGGGTLPPSKPSSVVDITGKTKKWIRK